MNSNSEILGTDVIGRCTRAEGEVRICAPGGVEKPLLDETSLRVGDKIIAGAGCAVFALQDGTAIALGSDSMLRIDAFAYENDAQDNLALLTVGMGTLVIEAGDLAIGADDFTVCAGESTCGLRSARIAVRVDPLGYDMVTLLPPRRGPLGEVLVHNKIGVQMLNRAYQTLRLGGGDADIPAPLTLPSGVIRETYAAPGIADAMFSTDPVASNEDLSEDFQPFRALQDRLLERQFMIRTVFPSDGPAKTGEGDEMLEDAFEGTRFRLSGTELETSGS